jgi:hypothetical protein
MQLEVEGRLSNLGILGQDAATAAATPHMQRKLTLLREKASFRDLDAVISALPRDDPRRCSWMEAGDPANIAGKWLSGRPCRAMAMHCTSSEFAEMVASYLGINSPAASAPGVLGRSFSGHSGSGASQRTRFVVDAGGWEIERVQMPGDGWRDQHDFIEETLFNMVFQSGISGCTQPRGLFNQAIPEECIIAGFNDEDDGDATHGPRASTRPGLVPDAALTVDGCRFIYDVKCTHLCPLWYWNNHRHAVMAGGALTLRANRVVGEYHTAAAKLDERVERWLRRRNLPRPPGMPTAVEILAALPPVKALVFGSTACGGSKEVGTLLGQLATSAANRQWRSMGTRNVTEARAFILSIARRRMSFAAAVAKARLRLSRLEMIGQAGRVAGRHASSLVPSIVSPTIFMQESRGALGGGGGRAGFMGVRSF